MIYLPIDHLEQIVVAGKFQKPWVASGPVQIFTRNFSNLVELTGTIEWFLQAELYTIELLFIQEVGYCVETCRGNPLVLHQCYL